MKYVGEEVDNGEQFTIAVLFANSREADKAVDFAGPKIGHWCAQFAGEVREDEDCQCAAWVRLGGGSRQRDILFFPKSCQRFQFFWRRAVARGAAGSLNGDALLDSVLIVLDGLKSEVESVFLRACISV